MTSGCSSVYLLDPRTVHTVLLGHWCIHQVFYSSEISPPILEQALAGYRREHTRYLPRLRLHLSKQ